ncbi:cytochrome P450 [Schizophyllum commune]
MTLATLSAIAATFAFVAYAIRRRHRAPLPPGPKGWPIIGNLLDIPSTYEWEKYMQWARELRTDILHIDAAGTSIIILDSYKACCDLLAQRAQYYSDRPAFPMTIDLMGMDFNFAFIPYGEGWRARRRIAHESLHGKASINVRPLELKSTHTFLRNMLDAGEDDLEAEIRLMTGRLIVSATYGIHVRSKEDPHIVEAELLMRRLMSSAAPGAYLVNSIPALKYVPEWMPGANFQAEAREWRSRAQEIVDRPFNLVRQSMADGNSETPSFVARSLKKGGEDRAVRDAAATMYNGGTDTTVVTILNFVLAMLDNPSMQRRAQRDLDAVLGPLRGADGELGRLPVFDDEERLPYITDLARESSRYRPVLPMSIPHAYNGEQPDIYKGYAIPCGSIVIPNVWLVSVTSAASPSLKWPRRSMAHDEKAYPDPYAFKPERYLDANGTLDTNVRDPAKIIFGFGRRNCIGRHVAYSTLWITIASILRVYNIEKAKRSDGSVIEPCREWVSALIQSPKHFKCVFTPRSADAVAVLRATELASENV